MLKEVLSTSSAANWPNILKKPLHFERTELAAQLKRQLLNDQLVVLLGSQGNGKSTIASKDLRQLMEKDTPGAHDEQQKWQYIHTRPYIDPIGNLARSLAMPGVLFPKGSIEVDFQKEVEEKLQKDSFGLVNFYRDTVARTGESFNLLLTINQEQDLFRFQSFVPAGDDERYLKLILTAAFEDVPIYIVFITDSENIQHFSQYRGMPEAINNYRFEVSALSFEEVKSGMKKMGGDAPLEDYLLQALEDYRQLLERKDKYALFKLSYFLTHNRHQWERLWRQGKTHLSLAEFYTSRLGDGLFYSLNQQLDDLYSLLGEREQKTIEYCCKALSEQGQINNPIRRPVTMRELVQLCNRPDMPAVTQTQILGLVDHFNDENTDGRPTTNFVTVANKAGADIGPESVVDFSYDVIMGTWFKMRRWVEEEGLHAGIFHAAQRRASRFVADAPLEDMPTHESKTVPQESKGTFKLWLNGWLNMFNRNFRKDTTAVAIESPKKGIQTYRGAELVAALTWLKKSKPNEAWANRYPLPEKKLFNESVLQKLKTVFKESDPKKVTGLRVAKWFVQLSERKERERIRQEEEKRIQQLKQANRQKRIAFILATAAVILSIVSIIATKRATDANRNLELIDLVEVLNLNRILAHKPESDLREVERLELTIATNKEINSSQKVLDFLVEKKHLLISEDEIERNQSFKALLSIDELYDELKTGSNIQKGADFESGSDLSPSTWKVVNLSQQLPTSPFKQYPYVYYALGVQIKVLKGSKTYESEDNLEIEKSLIEDLASNPKDESQRAYGDRNGNLILAGISKNSTPYEVLLTNAGGPIRAIEYSPNGENLYIGTPGGKLSIYDNLDTPGTTTTLKELFTFAEENIAQIIPLPNEMVIVRTFGKEHKIHLLDTNPTTISRKRLKQTKILSNIKRVSHIAIDPDYQYLTVSGRDKSLIYQIDLEPTRNFLFKKTTIEHPGTTIFRSAMKTYTKLGKSWFFLASETGDVWYTEGYENLFTADRIGPLSNQSDNTFTYRKPHQSSVTVLAFNSGYPQLASASLDGTMQFWNLLQLEESSYASQQIRLRNLGQGIWDMCYINDQEVIIAENINTQVWRTTVQSQLAELKRLLCEETRCK